MSQNFFGKPINGYDMGHTKHAVFRSDPYAVCDPHTQHYMGQDLNCVHPETKQI